MVLLFIVFSICNSDYSEENKSNEQEKTNMDNASKHRLFLTYTYLVKTTNYIYLQVCKRELLFLIK